MPVIRTFIETPVFKRNIDKLLKPEEYRALQNSLIRKPEQGARIRNAGGARKLRFAHSARHKGKRGGIRVIYYLYENKALLLLAYTKDKQDNLSNEQRVALKNAITTYLDLEG